MKTGISVRDAMTARPITITESTIVEKCAKIMLEHKVGSLIVVEGNSIVGMITERDFVNNVIARGLDPKKLTARDIMRINIITISPNIDIFEAMLKMNKEHVRRLPVVENNKIIGFLTHRDILKIQPELFALRVEKMAVKESERKPITRSGNIEGECEKCENYTLLHNIDGRFICDECRD